MRCSTTNWTDRVPNGWIMYFIQRVEINAHSEVGPSKGTGIKTANANKLRGIRVPSRAATPVTPPGEQTVQALEKEADVFALKCDVCAHLTSRMSYRRRETHDA